MLHSLVRDTNEQYEFPSQSLPYAKIIMAFATVVMDAFLDLHNDQETYSYKIIRDTSEKLLLPDADETGSSRKSRNATESRVLVSFLCRLV